MPQMALAGRAQHLVPCSVLVLLLLVTAESAAAPLGPYASGGCPVKVDGFTALNNSYFLFPTYGPSTVALSSNQTLAPFSSPVIPIEELFLKPKEQLHPTVCDASHRCIASFELVAAMTDVQMGFKDLETGEPLVTQLLTYDGTFPGPQINVPQGVQSLVRLRNFIHCNTSTMTPINATGTYYGEVTGLTLHLHGAATVSPFDGWTADNVQACQWKDYVYDNSGFLEALWYHDHAMGVTAVSVACGLAGTYQVRPCDVSQIPTPLQPLYPAQYLTFNDQLFIQEDGSEYMNPDMFPEKVLWTTTINGKNLSVPGWIGDHNMVNGRVWPVVTVQRKPYWFVLHNAAQSRAFNLVLYEASTNQSVNALPGRVFVVGSDGGLRTQAVQAPDGILMGSGERYQVVIDFSQFANGTELILHNDPVPNNYANFPFFCYSHLMMKLVVVGEEALTPPFDPFYQYSPQKAEGQNDVVARTIEAACSDALEGRADVRMETSQGSIDGHNPTAFFTNMPDDSSNGHWQTVMLGTPGKVDVGKRHRKLRGGGGDADADASGKQARRQRRVTLTSTLSNGTTTSMFLPHSLATNGWSTWSVYNTGNFGIHPIHLHLVQTYMCGRTNNVTGDGVRDYELFTPKDMFFVGLHDDVSWITRMGPHQGEYQFHCHNLQHEDEGLMGLFNSTDPSKPQIKTTYWHGLLEPNRTAGFENTPSSVKLYKGTDPLVYSYKKYPYIGHDLYNYDSMPPWAQRTDPSNPKLPQPITETLLRKVLKRGYYEIFYPNDRIGFSKPVKNNPYAFVCPNLPYTPAK